MGRIDINTGKKTDESLIIHAFSTSVERRWEYSVNDGDWKSAEKENSSEVMIVIENLTPNTEYKISVRTNIFNTKYILVKTLPPLSVYSPSDVYIDSKNPRLTFTANIPTGFFNNNSTTVYIRRVNEQMGSNFVVNLKNGKNSIGFVNPNIIDGILRTMSKSKDMVFTALFYYSKNDETYSASLNFHCKTSAENSAPILTDFVYKDGNTGLVDSVTGNNQLLVQNQSGLVVTITPAEPRNYATISAYTVTVGNVSVSTVEERVSIGRVDLSGAVPIVVTAIDSRGYTATMTKIVNYIPYTPIELTELSIERINNIEKMTKFYLSGSITPIMIDGIDKNPLKAILYQTRPTNEQSFGELIEIPQSNIEWNGNNFTADISQWVEFDSDKSFYIQVITKDQLTQDQEIVTLPNGKPLLALRKGMLGINNNNPQHALDIDGDLNLTGKILINGEEINVGGITE